MLLQCSPIKFTEQSPGVTTVPAVDIPAGNDDLVCDLIAKPNALGVLRQNTVKHYYSSGAFNLIQLVMYILRQTGPAHIFLSTYSISERSITALKHRLDDGRILSARFLIDNRVRSISPKPYDHLITSFPDSVRCRAIHAKVALIYNNDWHVSVVGSQNATHNPKLERGIIHTQEQIFNFDFKILNHEFESGTT